MKVFGGRTNIPPLVLLTSICSFFTKPDRSNTSRAAEIAFQAPNDDGSFKTSTMPNAVLGAFMASIIDACSVISFLCELTTSAVFVV